MKILIIIPAYKEADNIERLVDDIILNHPICDYVIINDGSHDATRSICREKDIILLIYRSILVLAAQCRRDTSMLREKGMI